MKFRAILGATLLTSSFIGASHAHQSGDWILRLGSATVDPRESSSSVRLNGSAIPGSGAGLDSDTQLGITLTYMATDHIGIELIAATPFSHTVSGTGSLKDAGLGKIADIKHLPPTLTAQYFFGDSGSTLRPYFGAGINYTRFFSESASGAYRSAFGPSRVSLDDSWGFALKAGLDYRLGEKLMLSAGIWYLDISTDARIRSRDSGDVVRVKVDVDPFVYMLGLGYRF